jgi:hypothetical protein
MRDIGKTLVLTFGLISLLPKVTNAQTPAASASSPSTLSTSDTEAAPAAAPDIAAEVSPVGTTETEPVPVEPEPAAPSSDAENGGKTPGAPETKASLATEVPSADAKAASKRGAQFHIGFAGSSLKISGLHDVHISDWQSFGTGPAEGRIHLPLAKGNTQGFRPGLLLGYRAGNALGLRLEGAFYPGKASLITVGLGLDYEFFRSEHFGIGLVLKGGYGLALVSAGKAQVLPGKTPPIITPIGTFNEGDSVSANVHSIFGALAVTGHVFITSNIGLRLDAGYQLGKSLAFDLKAGDVKFSGTDKAVVRADGSVNQAHLEPRASLSGPVCMLGIVLGL